MEEIPQPNGEAIMTRHVDVWPLFKIFSGLDVLSILVIGILNIRVVGILAAFLIVSSPFLLVVSSIIFMLVFLFLFYTRRKNTSEIALIFIKNWLFVVSLLLLPYILFTTVYFWNFARCQSSGLFTFSCPDKAFWL